MKKSSVLMIMLWFSVSCCSEIKVADLLQQMSEQRAKIKSYSAEVLNTVDGSLLKNKQTSQDLIYFKVPGLLRTDTLAPRHQITLSCNGKTYLFDSQGNYQEASLDQTSEGIDKQLTDPAKILDKFDFTVVTADQTTIKMVGIPKSDDAREVFSKKIFSKIVFYIDANNYFTKEIRVQDAKNQEIIRLITEYQQVDTIYFPSHQKVTMHFSGGALNLETIYQNLKINPELSPQTFELDAIQKELKAAGGI